MRRDAAEMVINVNMCSDVDKSHITESSTLDNINILIECRKNGNREKFVFSTNAIKNYMK